MTLTLSDPKALLTRAFECALHAAAPAVCLDRALAEIDVRTPAVVIGAGKAAAAMAAAFSAAWEAPVRGLVVTRYGHGLAPGEDAGGIEVVEAGHPSPDGASLAAGARLLELARSVGPGERLVGLISGGGSALASAPLDGLAFEEKRDAATFLIRAGADIREINCVRKHLSGLKGGRLASAARPAAVVTFAISDVPGDDPADIASGPTLPDRTTQRDALEILHGYGYPRIDALRAVLDDPRFETPKPDDPTFAEDTVRVVASNATALDAAQAFLEREGLRVVRLGDDLDGEAQALGREHARLALELARSAEPVAILSGGETRVVLGDAEGRGGRNLEYLAGLALELAGAPGIFALAADTDGIDGQGDHAGGLVTPDMLARGAALGLSLEKLLARHDSYRFFGACDLLLRTGPTRTNVNDFRLIVCRPNH
ncbi:MAG TPA: glycerate kinase [Gammaproteobacteria bacterium]